MNQLIIFFKTRWQEIVIFGLWLPTVFWALQTGSLIFFILSLFVGLVLYLVLQSLVDKYKNRGKPSFGGPASNIPRKGIIFTVGLQTKTIQYSIEGQKPSLVGFLCTNQTINHIDEVVSSKAASSIGINENCWRRELVDPRDIEDVRIKTTNLINWMIKQGLLLNEIVLDPTGGLTPVSLGAFSAAQELQIDSQYVRSRFDENNQPIPGTQELIFISRYSKSS